MAATISGEMPTATANKKIGEGLSSPTSTLQSLSRAKPDRKLFDKEDMPSAASQLSYQRTEYSWITLELRDKS